MLLSYVKYNHYKVIYLNKYGLLNIILKINLIKLSHVKNENSC